MVPFVPRQIFSTKVRKKEYEVASKGFRQLKNVLQLAKDSDESNSTMILKIFNLFAIVKCQMHVHAFPFDHQECILKVSWGLQEFKSIKSL